MGNHIFKIAYLFNNYHISCKPNFMHFCYNMVCLISNLTSTASFQPLPETVALVEDIVVEYVTDMVSKNNFYPSAIFHLESSELPCLLRYPIRKMFRCLQLCILFPEQFSVVNMNLECFFLLSLGAQSSRFCHKKRKAYDRGFSVFDSEGRFSVPMLINRVVSLFHESSLEAHVCGIFSV